MCFNEVCIEQSARSNITLALCHSLPFTEILQLALHCTYNIHSMSKLISNNNFDMVTLALSIKLIFFNVLIFMM